MLNSIRSVIILLAILFLGCNDQDLTGEKVDQIDSRLCLTLNIEPKYFDSLVSEYGDSQYIKAMYWYLLSNKENAGDFYSDLRRKKNEFNWGGIDISLAEAHLLSLLGDSDSSRNILKKALNDFGPNHWVFFELASFSKGRERIELLDSAMALKPKFYRAAVAKAFCLDVITEHKEIIAMLEGNKSRDSDIEVLNFLAEAYFFKKDINRSFELYKESVSIAPNVRAYLGIGNTYHYQFDDLGMAYHYYDLALGIDSLSTSAIRSKGWLLFDLDSTLTAIKYFDKLKVRCSELNEIELEEGIDFYLLAGLSETARFFFQAAFKKFGDSPRVMGYYLILNWSATNHEVNDLNISSYEKKFGPINVKWLKEKINELGISRRSISVPGTEIG